LVDLLELNDTSRCKGSRFEEEGKQKFGTRQSEGSSLLMAPCAIVILELCFPLAHEGCSHVFLCSRDLSETAISQMPTLGLKDLEILRLQDTESLKKFPSIYNFEVSCYGLQSKTACHRVESIL